jgi:predicted ATP-dependent endonuclease of OLD family
MKISEVQLTNFRCFESLTLRFDPGEKDEKMPGI